MIYGNTFLPEYIQLEEQAILNEVYFGKNEEMQRLESAISRVRYTAREKGNKLRSNDKSIIDLCKAIENIFGFSTVGILLNYTNIIDISCSPIGRRIGKQFSQKKMKENLLANEKTFKFNKSANYNVLIFVSTGLLVHKDLTDAEVTAAFLHEIGRNFSECFNPNKIEVQGFWMFKIVGTILNIFATCYDNFIRLAKNRKIRIAVDNYDGNDIDDIGKIIIKQQIADKVDVDINVVKKVITVQLANLVVSAILSVSPLIDASIEHARKGMNKFGYNLSKLFGFGLEIKQNLENLIPFNPKKIVPIFTSNPISTLAGIAIDAPVMMNSFKNKRLADKFVAVYGYSAELSSFINKTDTSTTGIKTRDFLANNKFIGILYNSLQTAGEAILTIFDDQPVAIDRLVNNMKELEKELMKTDLQEEQKKAIQEDIDETKKIINQMIGVRNGFKDNFIAKKLWYGLLYKLFGGDPRKFLIGKDDDMDQVYDDAVARAGKR